MTIQSEALIALAAKVEQATEPDLVLDGMIEALVQLNAPGSLINCQPPLEFEADDETGSVAVYAGNQKVKVKRYRAPAYTASLDSAMKLVPEGWHASTIIQDRWKPELWYVCLRKPRGHSADAKASFPRAIAAASLRALAAQPLNKDKTA